MFDVIILVDHSSAVPSDASDSISAVLHGRTPGDVLVVTADGEQLTARQCLERSAAAALALRAAGVRAGDRVAVLHDLSADALILWWALSRLGAVYLPLNPSWTPRLAGRVVTDRRVAVVLAEARHRARAMLAAPGATVHAAESFTAGRAPDGEFRDSPTAPLEDCCVVHNSGRPGIDHGVRGSWRQFAVMGGNMAAMHSGGRVLVAAPPCFMGVLLSVYGAIASGGSVALLPGLTAETFWPAIRRAGVTSAAMLNPTLADLLARPPGPDDRDHPLRLMIGNASEAARNAAAGARFGVHWLAGLGKTEVCGAVGTDLDPVASAGVGRVRAPFVGRVVDPDSGHDLPAGTPGELVLQCTVEGGLPVGYADDADATAELWRDGWLHTGWHVRVDEAGCVHPVGINSIHPIVVKRAGYLFAADLESEIRAVVDGVASARIGTRPGDDERDDPIVVAWLTGTGLDRHPVSQQLREGLPAHLVPDLIVVTGELPIDPATADVPVGAWRVRGG